MNKKVAEKHSESNSESNHSESLNILYYYSKFYGKFKVNQVRKKAPILIDSFNPLYKGVNLNQIKCRINFRIISY